MFCHCSQVISLASFSTPYASKNLPVTIYSAADGRNFAIQYGPQGCSTGSLVEKYELQDGQGWDDYIPDSVIQRVSTTIYSQYLPALDMEHVINWMTRFIYRGLTIPLDQLQERSWRCQETER